MVRSALTCSSALFLAIGLYLSIGPAYTGAEIIGAWLFDEGSGEVAKDSSGRGVDGVLTGGPEWVEGKFGGALKLEPNKYVDFPPPLSEKMILEKEFTCMAWMNPHKWEKQLERCIFYAIGIIKRGNIRNLLQQQRRYTDPVLDKDQRTGPGCKFGQRCSGIE